MLITMFAKTSPNLTEDTMYTTTPENESLIDEVSDEVSKQIDVHFENLDPGVFDNTHRQVEEMETLRKSLNKNIRLKGFSTRGIASPVGDTIYYIRKAIELNPECRLCKSVQYDLHPVIIIAKSRAYLNRVEKEFWNQIENSTIYHWED